MSENLSILYRNVGGPNMPARCEATRDMIIPGRPMIVCLQETKLATVSPTDAAGILGPHLDAYELLSAQGTWGGILMGWQSTQIDASELDRRTHSLSMKITVKWLNIRFLLTLVYSPTDDDAKQNFLHELRVKLLSTDQFT
jgi:hypothetical protein